MMLVLIIIPLESLEMKALLCRQSNGYRNPQQTGAHHSRNTVRSHKVTRQTSPSIQHQRPSTLKLTHPADCSRMVSAGAQCYMCPHRCSAKMESD